MARECNFHGNVDFSSGTANSIPTKPTGRAYPPACRDNSKSIGITGPLICHENTDAGKKFGTIV